MKYNVKLTDKQTVKVTLNTYTLRLCDDAAIKEILEDLKNYSSEDLRTLASTAIRHKEANKPTALYRDYRVDEILIDHIEITRENENILPWLYGLAIHKSGDIIDQMWAVEFNIYNAENHFIRSFNDAD